MEANIFEPGTHSSWGYAFLRAHVEVLIVKSGYVLGYYYSMWGLQQDEHYIKMGSGNQIFVPRVFETSLIGFRRCVRKTFVQVAGEKYGKRAMGWKGYVFDKDQCKKSKQKLKYLYFLTTRNVQFSWQRVCLPEVTLCTMEYRWRGGS